MNSPVCPCYLGKEVLRSCRKLQEVSRNDLPWNFIPVTNCRGFIKTAANNLKNVVEIKNLKSKIENFLFVFPRHIWLKEEVDGKLERPLRAETAKGPRTSLATSEMVKDATIEIELHLLPHGEITWKIVEELLDYGRYEGISQWRGASYGRFTWERIN